MSNDNWDYTDRAASYDARAAYSPVAISKLLDVLGCVPWEPVADIGAGTGKLTLPLLDADLTVRAIEPNDAMRAFGISNTKGRSVTWSKADMHSTGLDDSSVANVFFGSSFNVAEQQKTLKEVARILKEGGAFACMWNHRDLVDPLQAAIEDIFRRYVPDYSYGKRREDPTKDISTSGLFDEVNFLDDRFVVSLSAKSWVDAWNSHATVARQVGEPRMKDVVSEIRKLVGNRQFVSVPYHTRIWWARCNVAKKDWRTSAQLV